MESEGPADGVERADAVPVSLKPRLVAARTSMRRSYAPVPGSGKAREHLRGTIVLVLILVSSAIALYDLGLLARFLHG